MDNRSVDVVSTGSENLKLAMSIAWANSPAIAAVHYKTTKLKEEIEYRGNPTNRHISILHEDDKGAHTLILFWGACRGSVPLPFYLNLEDAFHLAAGWLRGEQTHAGKSEIPKEDHITGWRVFTGSWGMMDNFERAIMAIQPVYLPQGK